MCMEILGFLIKDECDSNLWDPIKASRGGPALSHLFFADNLVLFGKANEKNCQSIKDTLEVFCELSGQKVNNDKSRIYFSPNVEDYRRDMICSCLNLHSTPNLGTYLGFLMRMQNVIFFSLNL